MSENEDAESRTEDPTEKKIRDTIDQGRTPVSRDVATAFGAFALLGALAFLADVVTPRFVAAMALMLDNVGAMPLRMETDAYEYLTVASLETARMLAPILLVIVLSGLAASFVQGAPQIVFDRIQPDLSRISITAGWRRIFGLDGLLELGKAVAKLAIVGGAVAFVGLSDRSSYIDAMRTEPSRAPALALSLMIHLTSVVAIALAILALADFIWARFKWRRDLRMSRQELKEEFKQAEGDPFVKARMRSLAMDRSRRRMMASVPKASFVVANPTHYAVALRYVREEGGAPLVLAKGKDLVALKIREIAEKNGVPVLERKELARAMFEMVEVDRMIPSEFYRPVAELIHYLHSLGRKGY